MFTALLTASHSSVSSSGVVTDLCGVITGGTNLDQRLGRAIHILRFTLQGTLVVGAVGGATDDPYNTLRVVVSSVYQPGVSVGIDTIIQANQTAGVERMYYDRAFVVNSLGNTTTGYVPGARRVELTVPINRTFFYNASSGAGNPVTLQLNVVSDSAAVVNPGFTSGRYAIYFVDA